MNPQRAATWISFRSNVKRSLTTAPPAVTSPLLHRQNLRQNLTSTAIRFRKIPKNHFTSNRVARQENDNKQNDVIVENSISKKRKNNSKSPNSLRKVAVEAQRSQAGLIRGRGKTRHVDPDVDTKDVTAYCAAETYNLTAAKQELEGLGYRADPEATGLFPQVLHVQTTPNSLKDDTSGVGDVFIFPSGCVVTWHVPERTARELVTKILPIAAAEAGHLERMEEEEMEFIEDTSKETSRIIGDTIILGTKRSEPHQQTSDVEGLEDRTEIDTILAKIAFSSALARSTKLAVLENRLSAYFASTQSIPLTLASGKPVRHTRSEILQKTGELLLIRAQLNLYSELTDSLPDLFWDSPHELGLEGYYEMDHGVHGLYWTRRELGQTRHGIALGTSRIMCMLTSRANSVPKRGTNSKASEGVVEVDGALLKPQHAIRCAQSQSSSRLAYLRMEALAAPNISISSHHLNSITASLASLLHNTLAKLLILSLRNPHLVKRAQTTQHTPSNPRAKFPLRRIRARNHTDLRVRIQRLQI
ncbi:unnamed protein product [Zymoseptoria tritici ST99CH_3D7]|uniref:DUF155 domain-containing protein n=1 Tax=Zymoseptoria tritici (strain ST99CH_3D7) TaxID=1276538 RepID=A0A1X7S641_ZYMT9|nr:unnamed protein product [Zymoseptoria tritici ST99CH_3D7]